MSINNQSLSNCPMCKSTNLSVVEIIHRIDLISLYKKQLNIDISELIGAASAITYLRCNECDLRFFTPLITGDEKFYNVLQHHEWYYVDSKDEYLFAAKFTAKTDKVLDIGSGKGAFAKCLPTSHFTGLEFSTEARLLALKNDVHVINESVQDHALKNIETYDVVTSFQVLEHVSDIHSFIDSAVTCLKPGGYLILAVPSYDSFLKHVVNGVLNLPPHHVSHWSDQSVIEISRIWNLDVIDLHHEHVAGYHKQWQLQTFYSQRLRAMVGVNRRLIDYSFISKIIRRVSSFLANKARNPSLENEFLNGHTVTVVMKKGNRPSNTA